MNWGAIDFDWNQARAFLAAVQTGSFSAAARTLGQTQPTISRQISALETALGVVLFERSRRSLTPTDTGLALAEHVRAMADGAIAVRLAATGRSDAVEGLVTITATSLFASRQLAPVVAEIRREFPGIDLEITASNALQDLKRREADIAVRHARPTQADLIGRLIGETTAYLCATPAYFDRCGRPRSLADLTHHEFIGFDQSERTAEGLASHGLTIDPATIRTFSTTGEVQVALCRADVGLLVAATDLIHEEGFEPILQDQFRVDVPTWLVAHRELNTSRRIRLVFDALADRLSTQKKRAAPGGTARVTR
ncbi:LysR family transcriptional regulator [Maricaulaceae bacterium MS644]